MSPETRSAIAKIRKALGSNTRPEEREEAIRMAIQYGIPLYQIEAFLDWVELVTPGELRSSASVASEIPGSAQPPSGPLPESG